jgi:hypothetical protein
VKPVPRRLGGVGFISFELVEAMDEFLAGSQHLAQLYEGAHNVDAHLDGPGAVEDCGGHGRSMLSEGVRGVLTVLSAASL